MENIITIIQVLATVLGCLAALMNIPLFIQFRWPAAAMWGLKVFTSALSPVLILLGVLIFIVGFATGSDFIKILGLFVVIMYLWHTIIVTRPPLPSGNFQQAFGPDWKNRIDHGLKKHFLSSRRILKLPNVPNSRMEQNFPFSTIPGTQRQLLCDLWQPPLNIAPSGLAFIYLHGSAFYFLDKDLGTRPFFGHLAAQGHVIMDVAYRLFPETDMMGMVHDVKRAICWMKENAGLYGVNPHRIVVGGGSAGGHLALLAAYTASNPKFTPKELQGIDLSVCAVISLYGTTDLEAVYYHTNQHLTTRSIPGRQKKRVPTKMPGWMVKSLGKDFDRLGFNKGFENAGALAPLLGGHPDECPETYAVFSPINHVHSDCPPTLLIHGEHDIMAPVKSTRLLQQRLLQVKVPVVMHILPQTDHAFDLVLTKISPAAHNSIYDVEQFIALMV